MSVIFCGIDFHKNTSTLCFIFPDGTKEIKTISSSKVVTELANRPIMRVAGEIKALGHTLILIDTVKFKAIGIVGKKTDKSVFGRY